MLMRCLRMPKKFTILPGSVAGSSSSFSTITSCALSCQMVSSLLLSFDLRMSDAGFYLERIDQSIYMLLPRLTTLPEATVQSL